MAENGIFATAFRGFRKEDVLNYIDSLNTAHRQETADLQAQVETLSAQTAQAQQELPALREEVVTLRTAAEKLTQTETALQEITRQLQALQEENCRLIEKLQVAEEAAATVPHLQNETAVQKQQLDEQQAQLDTYERMFTDSADAVTFVRDNVTEHIRAAEKRTETALSGIEKLTADLATQLQALREQTAAMRSEVNGASTQDEQALREWFAQFEQQKAANPNAHFFRTAAGEEN